MSDPSVNLDIEDVLASIRRLVGDSTAWELSDVDQPKPAETLWRDISSTARAPANLTEPASTLVLSPAQRIDEGEDADVVESVEETLDLDAASLPEDTPFFARAPEAPADAPRETRSRLLATIAELEAAVDDRDEEFEPDGSETTPIVDWNKTRESGAIFRSRAAKTASVEGEEKKPTVPQAPHLVSDDTTVQQIEAVEDDVSEPVANIAPPTSEAVASPAGDVDVILASGLDEAALRTLITDIVRDELQGALGDRISRNVRKLVRREVYRALAAEDLD